MMIHFLEKSMKSTTKQADDQSDKPLTPKYVGKRMSKRQYAQVLASLTSPHARGAWRRLYFDRQRQHGAAPLFKAEKEA
jgi:hypothetical protein